MPGRGLFHFRILIIIGLTLCALSGSQACAADAAFTQFVASLWPEAKAQGEELAEALRGLGYAVG